MPTTFHLIRHGRTVWNEEGKAQGHADSPLTEKAIYETQLKANELAHEEFDAIYSSDLGRTKHTAKILASHHPHLSIRTSPRLRERGFGEFEGKSFTEYDKFYQAQLNKHLSQSESVDYHHWQPHPDMESNYQVATRVLSHLSELSKLHFNQTILIVTHGGVLTNILIQLQHATYKELMGKVSNLSRVILQHNPPEFKIQATPDIHL